MKGLVFAACLAIAASAQAAPPLELIAPRAGAVLDGGSESTLVWSAASLPAGVEEWEAFLSLDGGRYYAVGITPHLDAGIRSFRWRVPNVAAAHARILIRAGDERDEYLIELPQTFSIVPRAVSLDLSDLQVAPTDAVGESALPSSPAVVEWVSGGRRGADLVSHRHRDFAKVHGDAALIDDENSAVALLTNQASPHLPRHGTAAMLRSGPAVPPIAVRCPPRPLLLLTTRLNI